MRGKPIDLVVLQEKLKEKNISPEIAGIDFIRDILTAVPTSANIRSYAGIVHEKAGYRDICSVVTDYAFSLTFGGDLFQRVPPPLPLVASS